jgi:hypothetical protein
MLLQIEQLLQDKDKLVTIRSDAKLSDALAIMIENDYSQLPVVDKDGVLKGIVSKETIAHQYFHLNGSVDLLNLEVQHCQSEIVPMAPEDDLEVLLRELEIKGAVVLAKNKIPYQILTYYDTTTFFYAVARNLILLERIELKLRYYIEAILDSENKMTAALLHAFKADKREPTKPARMYDELSLAQHVQLIVTDENWAKFDVYLGPRQFFSSLMGPIGEIRNQHMHFRGEILPVQYDALVHALDWLEGRPKIAGTQEEKQQDVHLSVQEVTTGRPAGKYGALEESLLRQRSKGNVIRVTFKDVETILGEPLPQSAFEQRTWWANDSVGHVQSRAWMRAGWKVDDVDFVKQEVVFKQTAYASMQVFFTDVLQDIKERRPGLTRATRVSEQNWVSIGAGKTGYAFSWVLTPDEKLRVELYIDTGDKEENKEAFDLLKAQKDQVEQDFGGSLHWDRLNEKQACRIYTLHPVQIAEHPDKLEPAKVWAVETGLRLIDAFQPRIRELKL